MKKWEELKVGEPIYFINVGVKNIKPLIDSLDAFNGINDQVLKGLNLQETSITSISNDESTKEYVVVTDKFSDIRITYDEYFSEGHSSAYSDTSIIMVSASHDGIIVEIKNFFKELDINYFTNQNNKQDE